MNHRILCNIHNRSEYSEDFDAYYCPECNKWLETKCGNANCEFCNNRPDNPNATPEGEINGHLLQKN